MRETGPLSSQCPTGPGSVTTVTSLDGMRPPTPPPDSDPTVRVAVFDLGSTSFHLLVVDAWRDGTLAPVARRRSLLHLGADVARSGSIAPDRGAAAVRTLRRLHRAAEGAGADVVVAMATAALREAANGPALLDRFATVLGAPVVLLSGEEEAHLCLVGQRAGVWVGRQPVLGLDLGGGSLEAGICDATSVFGVTSVALGTGRLRGELGTGDVLGEEGRRRVAAVTRERAAAVAQLVADHPAPVTRVIASGGTVRALARLALTLHRPPPPSELVNRVPVNQVELPAAQVAELADRLVSADLDTRLALPGMQARRAAHVPVGAVVLDTVLSTLGLDRVVVSEWGLREGAVLSALALRTGKAGERSGASWRPPMLA